MPDETPLAVPLPLYDPEAETPFLEPDLRPPSDGLKRGVVLGVAGTAGIVLLAGIVAAIVRATYPPSPSVAPPPPPRAMMAQALPPLDSFLTIPTDFKGQDRQGPAEPAPKPDLTKDLPKDVPSETHQRVRLDDLPPLDQVIPPPPNLPPPATKTAPTGTPPPPAGGAAKTPSPRATPPPQERPKKKTWLFAEAGSGAVRKSPFEDGQEAQEGAQNKPAGSLFKQARWEVPADRSKVVYAQQIIEGQLMQAIDTDLPGTVRIRVTQEVQSRFGDGHVLVPLYTVFINNLQGRPAVGQKRIDIKIARAEFPEGGIADFTGATAGDTTGASGVPGEVNNHILNTILYAGISAALNIGTRAPFGSVTTVQPSLPQEYAQDVASSLSRTGNDLAKQQIQLGPTIIAHVGDPVTIMLNEAMSFQTPAVKVSK